MKLFWCCLLAAFVTVSPAAVDVEKTVREVQNILKANQQLPRLTRDEILQLLYDIRTEDAKSSSQDSGKIKDEKLISLYNTVENEVDPKNQIIQDSLAAEDEYLSTGVPIETTTKSNEPTLMVVLPYTPRDGSSLQELYTKPPRVEVVHVPSTTPQPKPSIPKFQTKVKEDGKLAAQLIIDFPDELQAFLKSHGLTGKPGQDNFLLPLEGFKPLPPARVVDGTVQLPENILLTYDLVAPTSDSSTNKDGRHSSPGNNFLYEPLRPELPFELDTSASQTKEISLPYDMPASLTKSAPKSNFDPIDYDSVRVIPLDKGINPVNERIVNSNNDQSKRQTPSEEVATEKAETTTTTTEEPKTNAVNDSSSAETDTGASITDLEDSFGGAAPAQPGDSELPPPRKNGFYWMLDWNSFLEVGDGDTKVNIRLEPKLGDPQMFLPVTVP